MRKEETDEFVANFDVDVNQSANKNHDIIIPGFLIFTLISVVITALITFCIPKTLTPEEKLINGYNELFQPDKNTALYAIGLKDILSQMNTDKSSYTLDVTLEHFPAVSDLEGIGIRCSGAKDVKNKKSENRYDITYCDSGILSSDVFCTENDVYIASPTLFDEVIHTDFSSLKNADDDSYLMQLIPKKILNEIDFNSLDNLWDTNDNCDSFLDIPEEYIKKNNPGDWKKICDGITVSEDKNNNIITCIISKESIRILLTDFAGNILNDKDNIRHIQDILKKYNLNYDENMITELTNTWIFMTCTYFSKGITINTTFNNKNHITGIQFANKYKLMGVNADLAIDIAYSGKNEPKESCIGNALFSFMDYEASLYINKDSSFKKGVSDVTHSYLLTFNNGNKKQTFYINSDEKYTKDSGEYSYAVKSGSKELDTVFFEIESSGTFSSIKRGEKFYFDLDSYAVNILEKTVFSISGGCSANKSAAGIGKPDGNEIYLNEMTKAEFLKLRDEIRINTEKMKSAYLELVE